MFSRMKRGEYASLYLALAIAFIFLFVKLSLIYQYMCDIHYPITGFHREDVRAQENNTKLSNSSQIKYV